MSHYQRLLEFGRHARLLSATTQLLQWDQETYMPSHGASNRGDQLALMASLLHKARTSTGFARALHKAIDLDTGRVKSRALSDAEKAAVRLWRRDFLKAKQLPNQFVQEYEKLVSEAMLVWAEARKNDAYMQFAPYLERLFEMARRKADYWGYKEDPYDALLDEFEPGMTKGAIAALFAELQPRLTALVKKIAAKPQVDDRFLYGTFSKDKVMGFCHHLLEKMGYDFAKGRLDYSAHPFSIALHPHDSRITTRWMAHYLKSNISTVLHEGGHGLYEMGLPVEQYGSPLGEAASLGIHESQSRLWETLVGQGKPFWRHFLPLLKQELSPALDTISLEAFFRGCNRVEPSLIRVEADEVTYTLHIILRFEIENGLLDGSIAIRDLPAVWKEKMKEYLGVAPPDNRTGCLQDIHWSSGLIGYFPTYALGNLYAAQFYDAYKQTNADWKSHLEQGRLNHLTSWLEANIHRFGRQYEAADLVAKVTGKAPSHEPYMRYLSDKYGEIYSL